MTVTEGSRERAEYYITGRTAEQMLKSISAYKKAMAGGDGDAAKAAHSIPKQLPIVEEFDGPKGTLLSLASPHPKRSNRSILYYEVRRNGTILKGGSEVHAENTQRTAIRLDDLADRY